MKKVQKKKETLKFENDVVDDIKIAKKSKEKKKEEVPKKVEKKLKYDYKALGIESPERFNYEHHDQDWCRYCGARYSSNFTKGPWGSRTLCTIHYIEWNQKKKLNLSSYKNLPMKPINVKENTELTYLNNMKIKNAEFKPEELEVVKKVKTEH